MGSARERELRDALTGVRARIFAAATAAGRGPDEVTLVVVTKTFPASDVHLLARLGVTDVAENKDQEAAVKVAACRDLGVATGSQALTWHFVGQLQTNKVRSVARYADVVQSVDRPRLVSALDAAAAQAGRRIRCLVQVALDDRPGRGGAPVDDVPALAEAVAGSASLDLAGVMAVAPLGADPDRAFARLAGVAATLRTRHPSAVWISAGMSDDLEQAVSHGATHVRVGRAVLGNRPPVG